MEIGSRIRMLRNQQNRTLQEVADACGVSKALLSKIETAKIVPALATLSKIAQTLGVKISALMEESNSDRVVFTPNLSHSPAAFVLTNPGYRLFAFAPQFLNKKMQPILINSIKGEVKHHSVAHEGEEFIYVLEGEVSIHIGSVQYTLQKGESIYFETMQEHGVEPVSDAAVYLDVLVE